MSSLTHVSTPLICHPLGSMLLLIFTLAPATAAQPAQAADAQSISFTSASPYQLADLLSAKHPVYDVRITADLVYPESNKATMPAFVFMHGSGGKLFRHQRYLELARSLGYATLQIDSFGPRRVRSTVGKQTSVTAAMMATDLLRALTFLSLQPSIDPDNVVVMGSSKGAIAALYASWTPIRKKVVGNLDYAGYLLLYPLCTTIEDGKTTASPVRVYIGEKDNWTPAAPCIEQVKRMRDLGRDWAITLYPGAYHAFDAPNKNIRPMPSAYSMTHCRIALRADGYEYEVGSGHLLSKANRTKAFRACAKKGSVKIGGYHAAGQLLTDVKKFLTDQLPKTKAGDRKAPLPINRETK